MSILADHQLRALSTGDKPLITPFSDGQVRVNEQGEKIISYGLSSYGYDLRLGRKFKIFTNVNNSIIDPKDFSNKSFVDFEGDVCIIPPNSFVLAVSAERICMPDNVVGVVLGKSTYARCFTGDTKVALVDGSSVSFKEMIERTKTGERFWGYGVNENADIIMVELVLPRLIGHEKIIELTLDSGDTIRCTPDHEFMMRDGSYLRADELKENASLLPLYRVESRGYEAVVQPVNGRFQSTHWLADDWNTRNNVYKPMENAHRHHLDENKRNNRPTNIVRKNASEHIGEHNLERATDPVFIKKMSETHKAMFAANSKDPEWYAAWCDKSKKAATMFHHDDEYSEARKKWLARLQDNGKNMSLEEREIRRERQRIRMLCPERKEKVRKHFLDLWTNIEFAKNKREQTRLINLRKDVTLETFKAAMDKHGSIRGAARELNCDRTTFRRFRDVVSEYKQKWEDAKVTTAQMLTALFEAGSIKGAARLLGIDHNYIRRRKDVLSMFFKTKIADNHKVVSIKELDVSEDVYCLTSPETGNFALETGVFVKNCGISCLATPLEPGWEGYVTLEFANTTPLPAKLYAGEGSCQVLFFEGEPCEVSYSTRNGKYNNQISEPVIPKT